MAVPGTLPAFEHLPDWVMAALRRAFSDHLTGHPLDEEQFRWELKLSPDRFRMIQSDLDLVTDKTVRPTALGLVQLAEGADVVDRLQRLASIARDRYRPGAAPIEADELRELLAIDPAMAEVVLPFARDLDLVEGPPWRVRLAEHRAQHGSLAEHLRSRYRRRYEAQRPAQITRRTAAPLATTIKSLTMHRFRAHRSLTLNLTSGLTVLVGRNGVGKSTVLDGFSFVAQALETSLAEAVHSQGGLQRLKTRGATAGPIELELIFEVELAKKTRRGSYGFELDGEGSFLVVEKERLELDGADPLIDGHRSVAILKRLDGSMEERFHATNVLALSEIEDEQRFPLAAQLRASLADVILVDRDPLKASHSDGFWSAAARTGRPRRHLPLDAFVQEIAADSGRVKHLEDVLKSLVPGVIERIDPVVEIADSKGAVASRLAITEVGLPGTSDIEDLSAGTRQMVLLAALHVSPCPPRLLLLEEPDSGLHPGALSALRDLLRSLAMRSTIVATTHSPAFVGLLDPEREVVALDRSADETKAIPLAAALRSQRWLQNFGDQAEAFVRAASERRP